MTATRKMPRVTLTLIDGDGFVGFGYRPGLTDAQSTGWTVLLGSAGWCFIPDYRVALAEVDGVAVSAPCADCGGSHFRAPAVDIAPAVLDA